MVTRGRGTHLCEDLTYCLYILVHKVCKILALASALTIPRAGLLKSALIALAIRQSAARSIWTPCKAFTPLLPDLDSRKFAAPSAVRSAMSMSSPVAIQRLQYPTSSITYLLRPGREWHFQHAGKESVRPGRR